MNRPPVVFLPGLLCDERLWREPAAGIADIATPVFADLTLDNSIAAMAERALASVEGPFSLAGLSMGGYVAMEIMRQAPERVLRLALFDTDAAPDSPGKQRYRRAALSTVRTGRFVGVSRRLLTQLVHPSHIGGPVGAEVMAMAERVGRDAFIRQQEAILAREDFRPILSMITVPTLIGVGDQDMVTPPERSMDIHKAVPGSELHVFRDCGHLPSIEKPDETIALLRNWLDHS